MSETTSEQQEHEGTTTNGQPQVQVLSRDASLRALAEDVAYPESGEGWLVAADFRTPTVYVQEVADYLAALSPAVVLSLLDRLAEAEEWARSWKRMAELAYRSDRRSEEIGRLIAELEQWGAPDSPPLAPALAVDPSRSPPNQSAVAVRSSPPKGPTE